MLFACSAGLSLLAFHTAALSACLSYVRIASYRCCPASSRPRRWLPRRRRAADPWSWASARDARVRCESGSHAGAGTPRASPV
ncbi:hypothetical protein PF005_g30834 [Phytophthora fragariae]|uniref:Secreted protein n=1 Tax=Phytophthora fragariae TaxID=53985 RepID=A0A6A4AYP8_9STRA|nr:hypothetical protein PF003_g26593 [Phytophthora fragariae]KAE8918678.1 hypothetical protein PF009_g31009 [Phytophthora fragariae]KAE8960617.1 hypothetical protein PF011_g30030 [Phytophthora fragariae]KAE9059775.1 hypothetical protein PF010_g30488 [Phytophthora fragariae]KAE9060686.1 hypothetical protein PF007_g30518 [Phytophthora fragariae]